MIGLTISHFHILEKLDGGAMGVAYKAKDIRLDREAGEFLSDDLAHEPKALERPILIAAKSQVYAEIAK